MDGSSTPLIDGESSSQAASALGDEAKALRLALATQLEKARNISVLEQLEFTVEEQLSELIVLISQYSNKALQRALVMIVGTKDDEGYTGRFPLHHACDTNAPAEVIQFFLQHEPTRTAVKHRDKWEDLPLHTACSRKDYTRVVELLLEYDDSKETVFTKRFDGSLPIHTACRYNAPPKVIQLLLDSDTTPERKTLFMDSLYGQVPLHIACRCNLNTHSMKLLLDHDLDKASVLMEDGAGRLPLHVAYLYCPKPSAASAETLTHPKSSIELLLEAMLHGRIERVGLLNWKHDMHLFLERLSVEERNFDASDKLAMTCEAFQMLLERAILLELAIWKSNCFEELNHDLSNSMKDLPDDVKRGRRIKSGAEMIIPGVLAFLEDEPVMTLLNQMGL